MKFIYGGTLATRPVFAYDLSKVKYWQLIDIPRPKSISSCVKQKQPLVATVCMSGLARDQFLICKPCTQIASEVTEVDSNAHSMQHAIKRLG